MEAHLTIEKLIVKDNWLRINFIAMLFFCCLCLILDFKIIVKIIIALHKLLFNIQKVW